MRKTVFDYLRYRDPLNVAILFFCVGGLFATAIAAGVVIVMIGPGSHFIECAP